MKIYTRVVIDMATGQAIEEESHEYSGPVDECKGGGSTTTNTQDKEYNRRMATIAEEQQDMYDQLFNFYKTGEFVGPGEGSASYADMEKAQIESNLGLIPQQTALQEESIAAQRELIPEQTALQTAQMGEEMERIEARSPLRGEYMKEALQTPDREQFANRFASDISNQFTDEQRQQDIQMGALGAKPGSTRSTASRNASMADRALAVASGKQQGRNYADEVRFQRLGSALGGM